MSYFFKYISGFKFSANNFFFFYKDYNKFLLYYKKKRFFKINKNKKKEFKFFQFKSYKKSRNKYTKNKNIIKNHKIKKLNFNLNSLDFFNFSFLVYLKTVFNLSLISLILLKMRSGFFIKNFNFYYYSNLFLKKLGYIIFNLKLFNFLYFFDNIFIFKKDLFFFNIQENNFKNSINFWIKFKNIKKLSFLQFFNDIIFYYSQKNKYLEFKETTLKELFKRQISKYRKIRYKWVFLKFARLYNFD